MVVVGCRVRAMLEEQACKSLRSTPRCPMQRSPPVLVPGCRVGAMLQKQACNVLPARLYRQTRRCPSTLGLDCRVRAWRATVRNGQAVGTISFLPQCVMQRTPRVFVFCCRGRAMLEK